MVRRLVGRSVTVSEIPHWTGLVEVWDSYFFVQKFLYQYLETLLNKTRFHETCHLYLAFSMYL